MNKIYKIDMIIEIFLLAVVTSAFIYFVYRLFRKGSENREVMKVNKPKDKGHHGLLVTLVLVLVYITIVVAGLFAVGYISDSILPTVLPRMSNFDSSVTLNFLLPSIWISAFASLGVYGTLRIIEHRKSHNSPSL